MKRCTTILLLAATAAMLGGRPIPAAAEPAGRSTLDETIGLAPSGGLLLPVPRAGTSFATRSGVRAAAARSPSSRS
jgi:hypothetical protein